MNIEHFIAKRISVANSGSFTRVIVRIAIAAIAVSLSVMILTTSIISGFKSEITNKIFGFWGHIHITDSNINRSFELTPINKTDKHYDAIRNIKKLEYQSDDKNDGAPVKRNAADRVTIGGVKGVHPYIILPGLLSTKKSFHGMLLKGVDQNYDWNRMRPFIVDGKVISFKEDTASSEILLSKNIADKMAVKTGDKVILSFIRDNQQIKRRLQISGIYNTGLEEYDKRFGIVDIRKLQEILGWPATDVQGMEVVLDDFRDMDVISDYIYYELLPQKFYAESIRAKFPSIFEWLGLQDINEKIILELMIIVAIINMITVLLILILERTQMIGILKSLGMNNWNIRKIFLYNAGYIIFYGLLIGNSVGLCIAFLQKHFKFITLDEANYYLSTAPIQINWTTILILNLSTFLITVIALILPTLLVTRITPVRALRFE
ncbi:MAG: ABC transporter permease [Saprospiraceae bacterium]|jgi:lipoprotein-releasing system permease protein|nr:ABC transporter permease [Saprospiraceae bacterium]MBL0027254.1 ABC transporter permease [Saprospiraceae bacterium]